MYRARFTLFLVLAACSRSPRDGAVADPPAGLAERQPAASAASAPPAPAPCVDDGWTTYAHDAARTSATGGCLVPPLRPSWSFAPRWVKGTPSHAARAIAAGNDVYVTGGIGPTPTIWRLDGATGAIAWTYITMADATRDQWPTLAGPRLFLVDDGVYSVDSATGHGHRGELDAWGESLVDGDRMLAENTRYWDGYGLYLSAFDSEAKLLWRKDYDALVHFFSAPDVGGLALDGDVLVHSAQHGALHSTALTALDRVSGERLWKIAVSPQSSPSIADGRTYEIERWPGEHADRLVARGLKDGAVAWSHEVVGARGPAPLLAAGRVFVHSREGVQGFERATGESAWSAPLERTADAVQSATTLAAATGSGSLVVVSGHTVHLLRIDDGSETWAGDVGRKAKRVEAPVIAGGNLYLLADGAILRFEGERPR
ncbi:MAG TPA: PQQ-binding-like beta-propeller repeat protein [Polyangiaceae bacterium]|jgi:outer membrane protein assembly factor BamB